MSSHQQRYKNRPMGFVDPNVGRLGRTVKLEERRRENRNERYARRLDVSEGPNNEETPETTMDVRLQRWKAERDLRKQVENAKKKPAFKVGVVHHKFYSPVNDKTHGKLGLCFAKRVQNAKHVPSPPKRITRATQKRLAAKAAMTPKKCAPSFAPTNYSFTAPAGLCEVPLFGKYTIPKNADLEKPWPRAANPFVNFMDRKENSPDSSDESHNCKHETSTPPRSGSPAPASFSPYIVSSRGKDIARKEQQIKIRRSLLGHEIPTKDTIMQNLNISVEEEEQTAQYFKFILESTIKSLEEMCNKWEKIQQEPNLSEDAQYQINQAIGQTNLLMRKKFERFRSLVLDCETGKGKMLVTCKDLQGFWDVVYIEVENCRSRFLKLDTLKSRDWIEEQIDVPNKRVIKKKTVAPKQKIAAKGSARSWILAARKKMAQSEDSNDINIVSAEHKGAKKITGTPLKDRNSRSSLREPSTSEIQGRRHSTPKATPRKTPVSLRKIVQLTQASKTIRSPLAIMKISKLSKTPKVTLDNTISYVNSDQTPAKGILKKSQSSASSESPTSKSTRKVDFDDNIFLDEVAVENEISEELQNSLDLGRALAKIDSYDADEKDDYSEVDCNFMEHVTIRKVEKRLDFEDETFIEMENTNIGEAIVAVTPETATPVAEIPEPAAAYVIPPIPNIAITTCTPMKAAVKTGKASLNWSDLYDISIEEDVAQETLVSAKVLRHRTVAATTVTKSNRRSMKSPARDKRLHDTSAKENCDPLRKKIEDTNSDPCDMFKESKPIAEQAKPRRSTRKSIKLADECTTCTPKPTTPRFSRSRKVSAAGENPQISVGAKTMEDLISFDSPVKRPSRTRRSSFKGMKRIN